MPEISRFMGMVIQMYYDDHDISHLHVRMGDMRCKLDLDGNLLHGNLPLSKLHILRRWIRLHNKELSENWNRIKNGQQLKSMEPWV